MTREFPSMASFKKMIAKIMPMRQFIPTKIILDTIDIYPEQPHLVQMISSMMHLTEADAIDMANELKQLAIEARAPIPLYEGADPSKAAISLLYRTELYSVLQNKIVSKAIFDLANRTAKSGTSAVDDAVRQIVSEHVKQFMPLLRAYVESEVSVEASTELDEAYLIDAFTATMTAPILGMVVFAD